MILGHANRVYGKGTKSDPLVLWMNLPEQIDRDMIWSHNNFARAAAKSVGLTHAWIIKERHSKTAARGEDGEKLYGPAGRVMKEDDMHITVRLGSGIYDCNLSAHIYVDLDAAGNPVEFMKEPSRRHSRSSSSSSSRGPITFWPWRIARTRQTPKTGVSLGAQWESYANTGPYLDTYRPEGSGAKRHLSPKCRFARPDTCEEAKELEAMKMRVDGLWAEYKKSVDEIKEAGGEPSREEKGRLLLMAEKIGTLEREIDSFREVQ